MIQIKGMDIRFNYLLVWYTKYQNDRASSNNSLISIFSFEAVEMKQCTIYFTPIYLLRSVLSMQIY